MKLLLIEDEPALSRALVLALKKLHFEVLAVTTLEDACQIYSEHNPEIILLDRTLPDGDGLEFCIRVRERGYSGGILMLTARGDIRDRVLGLKAGADDYLPKPFSWEELEARIESLMRRGIRSGKKEPSSNEHSEMNLWFCSESRLQIRGPKGWETLTALEFKLAQKLISSSGTIVKRDDLLKEVWGFQWLPQTRTVDYFMGRLRKRFEPLSEEPRHFLTVRGIGYRFEP